MDTRKIQGGKKRKEGKNNKTKMGIGREKSVVKPVAKRVRTRSREGGGEGRGDDGVSIMRRQKRESRAVGIGDGGEEKRVGMRGKDRGKSVDARTGFGNGLPPGVHRVGVSRSGGSGIMKGGGGGGGGGGRGRGMAVVDGRIPVEVHDGFFFVLQRLLI